MNCVPRLLILLILPLFVTKANATIIVSTSSEGGCSAPAGSTACLVPAFNGGLIVNGDFSKGSFAGFSGTATRNQDLTQGGVISGFSSYALLASSGSEQTLYQTVQTTPGDTYAISFDLSNFDNGLDQSQLPASLAYDFTAAFGNQLVLSIANPALPANGRKLTSMFRTVADSTSTTLLFTARNDPGGFHLTNISVKDISATGTTAAVTPEPESLVLLGTGVLGIFGVARRRLQHRSPGSRGHFA